MSQERFKWYENSEKVVLFLDLKEASEQELIDNLVAIKGIANSKEHDEIILLTDLTKAKITIKAINRYQQRLGERTKKIKLYAYVGLSGMAKLAARFILEFTDAQLKVYTSKEEAFTDLGITV